MRASKQSAVSSEQSRQHTTHYSLLTSRSPFFVAFVSFVVMVGCAGQAPRQSQTTAVPITAASDEGDIAVEAPVSSEQEQEESAIESVIEARIEQLQEWVQTQQFQTVRYGLDEQTKEFLDSKVGAVVQFAALYWLLVLGVGVGAWMIGIVLPKPQMPAVWEFVWWVVGTVLVAGTIILAILIVLRKVALV